MINEKKVKRFCKDYTLIENYEEAIADTKQTWHCHHILGEILSREQLLDHDFYYDVPPCMLKFVTSSEHTRLHNMNRSEDTRRKNSEAHKGKSHTEETRRKMSKANKGKVRSAETKLKISESMKGKHLSEYTRRKISEAVKRRWAASKKQD